MASRLLLRSAGALIGLRARKAQGDAIHPAGDHAHVKNAGGFQIEHGRYVGVGQIDVAADQGLHGQRAAVEVDRFNVEIVFSPQAGPVDGVIQALRDSGTAIAHLEGHLAREPALR